MKHTVCGPLLATFVEYETGNLRISGSILGIGKHDNKIPGLPIHPAVNGYLAYGQGHHHGSLPVCTYADCHTKRDCSIDQLFQSLGMKQKNSISAELKACHVLHNY